MRPITQLVIKTMAPKLTISICRRILLLVSISCTVGTSRADGLVDCYTPMGSWAATLCATRAKVLEWAAQTEPADGNIDLDDDEMARHLWRDFPREMDWLQQDNRHARRNPHSVSEDLTLYLDANRDTALERGLLERVIGQLEASHAISVRHQFEALIAAHADPQDPRWLQLYEKACRERREQRLGPVTQRFPCILFIKRHPVRPTFFAYTEGQSDAQDESHFNPNSALCLLEMNGTEGTVTDLLTDPTGSIRDIDVSCDGKRILFAWKKSRREDDYHLYEMDAETRAIRQITSGLGVADYEGRYLASGDMVFSSTRCVQTVDCWWTEVSNLYSCDANGNVLRRLGFDQVHTVYPAVLDSGRVIYTRWDYSDRGQVFPQGLFAMNPDGMGQTEYYGNSSWFPTTIGHARGIPGTDKVVAILMGHHSWQAGKLAVIDRGKGCEEDSGIQLIAPRRDNPQAEEIRTGRYRTDGYGQDEELFRHPWPLNEREFLVAMSPDPRSRENNTPFKLYYVDQDGNRELLVADPEISCNHPIPLAPRPPPFNRASTVDYRQTSGRYMLQDVYQGPGLEGIARGKAKALRVVAIEYRAAGVGNNVNAGESGGAMISTPISVGNGCWDIKRILGETPVYEDGSAFFTVPARTPVYFQILDKNGSVIQTMRSWSTLMPGETFSCVGCHEEKDAAPVLGAATLAAIRGPQPLQPFQGPPRGFSFAREVQPILDKHCIQCHDGVKVLGESKTVLNLTGAPYEDKRAKRFWSESYLTLTGAPRQSSATGNSGRKLVNWIDAQSRPSMLPPYHKGSATSTLIRMLREGHGEATLTREELHKIAAWIDLGVPFCGDYLEANAWNQGELDKYIRYQRKREKLAAEETRNREALIERQTGEPTSLPIPPPLYGDSTAGLPVSR